MCCNISRNIWGPCTGWRSSAWLMTCFISRMERDTGSCEPENLCSQFSCWLLGTTRYLSVRPFTHPSMSVRTDASSSRAYCYLVQIDALSWDAQALTQSPVSLCGVFLSSFSHAEDRSTFSEPFCTVPRLFVKASFSSFSCVQLGCSSAPNPAQSKREICCTKVVPTSRLRQSHERNFDSLWAKSHQGFLTLRMSGAHTLNILTTYTYMHILGKNIYIYIYVRVCMFLFTIYLYIHTHYTKLMIYTQTTSISCASCQSSCCTMKDLFQERAHYLSTDRYR